MDCSISQVITLAQVTYSTTHTTLCFETLKEPQGKNELSSLQTQLRMVYCKLISFGSVNLS